MVEYSFQCFPYFMKYVSKWVFGISRCLHYIRLVFRKTTGLFSFKLFNVLIGSCMSNNMRYFSCKSWHINQISLPRIVIIYIFKECVDNLVLFENKLRQDTNENKQLLKFCAHYFIVHYLNVVYDNSQCCLLRNWKAIKLWYLRISKTLLHYTKTHMEDLYFIVRSGLRFIFKSYLKQ